MGNSRDEQLDRIVGEHFMYEATDNVDGVLGTLADDAEHELVGGPDGPLRGKAALRSFYERLFSDLKGERVEPVMRLYGEDCVVDETLWFGEVHDGRAFKLSGKSGKARIRLLHVFKLRDGVIIKENVWFDFDNLKRQLA
jgi:ketosteroid isomerase-like protein